MKINVKMCFLLILSCGWAFQTSAQKQTLHKDSMINAARTDAKTFRLTDSAWKKYRHKLPYTSDHFKPQASVIADTALLHDSVYVDAYRQAAFIRNKHRRTAGHYVLIGGEIAVATAAALLTAIIIFVAPKMGG